MKRLTLFLALMWIGWSLRRRGPVSLRNKVILITGASSGIGEYTARLFAAEGARLVLLARREDRLAALKQELGPDCEALIFPADVSNSEELSAAVEAVVEKWGRIDVLVNNAGISIGGPFDEIRESDLRDLLQINLYGAMRLTQLVLPVMMKQRSGHIVNISSAAAELGSPGYTAYIAAKAGLNAFSLTLRREVSQKGVRVSVIMPGWTRTEMFRNFDEAELRKVGLVNPIIWVAEADTAARVIVEAVRWNRREVILGGPGFALFVPLARIAPFMGDFYFRWMVNAEKIMAVLRKSGV